jgi:hypothetical protein
MTIIGVQTSRPFAIPSTRKAPFRANIASPSGTFRMTNGTPKVYIKTADSGNRAHAFCPECGTPIYATAPRPNPSIYGLRVGAIDQRGQFEPPTRQAWCR